MFQKGNKVAKGRKSEEKVKCEYIRPTMEESKLLQVDPVMHDAMTKTSVEEEDIPSVMFLRPRDNQPIYRCNQSVKNDNLGYVNSIFYIVFIYNSF